MFIPNKGMELLEVDQAQMELRCYAVLGKDEYLTDLILDGADPHKLVAQESLIKMGKQDVMTPKEFRTPAKTAVFGRLYGRSKKSIMHSFGLTWDDTNSLVKVIDSLFPNIGEYNLKTRQAVHLDHSLTSFFGRQRRFSLITEEARHELYRQAANFPVQCLVPETRILTNKGYTMLKHVTVEDTVWTGAHWAPVSFVGHTEKPLCTLELSNGAELHPSPDHKFLVNGKGWVTTENLEEGDELVGNEGQSRIAGPVPPGLIDDSLFESSRNRPGDRQMPHIQGLTLPDPIGPDVAWLMGLMIGDGTYSHRTNIGFAVGCNQPGIMMKTTKVLKSIGAKFDTELVYHNGNPSYWRITMWNYALCRWFERLGLKRVTAAHKSIPEWMMTAPWAYKEAFVAGLWDADGSIGGSTDKGFSITYSTVSRKLAQDIQLLINSMGVRSNILSLKKSAKGRFDPSRVVISMFDSNRFNPPMVSDQKRKLLDVIQVYNNCIYKKLRSRYKVTVAKVTKTEELVPMMDITVDHPDHSFVAEGVVTHNSMASDINLYCMLAMYNDPEVRSWGIHPKWPVHDAVVFFVESRDYLKQLKDRMEEYSNDLVGSRIKFEAEMEIGPNWGTMEEVLC